MRNDSIMNYNIGRTVSALYFLGAVLMAEYLHYYILFQNHTDATAMYRSLKGKGMYAQISPTPRELSVCCGVSLLVHGEDVDRIKEIAEAENLAYLSISGLNNTFDNTRHKYG